MGSCLSFSTEGNSPSGVESFSNNSKYDQFMKEIDTVMLKTGLFPKGPQILPNIFCLKEFCVDKEQLAQLNGFSGRETFVDGTNDRNLAYLPFNAGNFVYYLPNHQDSVLGVEPPLFPLQNSVGVLSFLMVRKALRQEVLSQSKKRKDSYLHPAALEAIVQIAPSEVLCPPVALSVVTRIFSDLWDCSEYGAEN